MVAARPVAWPSVTARGPADLIAIPEEAQRLGAAFREAGHELHLVGGTVRDALMGRTDDDLDFTTTPDRMTSCGSSPASVRCGRPASSSAPWGVHLDERQCEITTFRGRPIRPDQPQSEVAYGGLPRRRPAAARLHHERDGAVGDR